MAKRLDFSLDFSTTHISATYISLKYLPSQVFARPMRCNNACFLLTYSTRWPNESIFTQEQFFCSIFVDKDEISLNITQIHSTHSTRWPNSSIFPSIFRRVKNRAVRSGPYLFKKQKNDESNNKYCVDSAKVNLQTVLYLNYEQPWTRLRPTWS